MRCSGIAKRLGCTLSSDDFPAMRLRDKELENQLDAFIALLNDEAGKGYEKVRDLLYTAVEGKITIYMNLGATAKSLSATIITKDKEIIPVEKTESLSVIWI